MNVEKIALTLVFLTLTGLPRQSAANPLPASPVVPDAETIFFYEFSDPVPMADREGLAPDLVVKEPAVTVDTGKEGGGALQITAPIAGGENANYAQISAKANEIFPTDAVSVDFFFCPDEALVNAPEAKIVYLLDQMYTAQTGLQLSYSPVNRTLTVRVGNGEKKLSATSSGLDWQAGEWRQLAFSYDAKSGELRLFENGEELTSSADPAFGSLDYGDKALRIGNRLGSYFGNAPGLYDNFRMTRRGVLFQ